ncbi:MAG: T9SS type A sorting domain-containing protein [Bacteroidetes bacterium]|nr:T9SS type A sorting domain-containing protein [Bacteroidota bacterium]MBP6401790.1 T9SS type A sorting domain-containing protein [Bacteroidia bacterium]
MNKLLLFFILIFGTSVVAQIPMQWQSQLPTSYDYDDMQMLDSNSVVAVGLTGSFIRTNDGGSTWKFVWTNTLMHLTGVDFTDYNTGYACGNGNMYYYEKGVLLKTNDGGNTWDTLSVPFDANFSDVDFISADTGWVVGDSGNVFRTYTGGLSWDNVSFTATEHALSIVMMDSDTGYVCGESGFLYRTFDGGNSWTSKPPITSNAINSLFFLNGRTGWCTTDFEQIFRTDNSGDTWTRQLNGGGTSPVNSVCFVDSLNGHALSTAFYYHTSNGGQSWQTENQTYHYNTTIAFSDAQHGFISGTHGNIQKTIDGGNSWTDIAAENNFYHFKNIQFTNASTGYCVGEHGKMQKTTDGGQTWSYLPTSTTYDLNDLFFLNTNLGYIVGETGSVIKTTDGGLSFTNVNAGGNNDLLSVYFLNSDTGWVCGTNSTVFKTLNGGTTWVPETLPSFTSRAYDIVFTDAFTGYIGSWANRIYKTTDGGSTWNTIPNLPSVNSIVKLQFLNPDTGWATSDYGDIMKTTDAGQTWTIQNAFCFSPASAFHFYDEWNGFAGGGTVNYNCKLFRTRDGGNTWENTDLPFGYSINGLWMTDTNRVYICGEWGSILLYGDTSNLSVGIPEHDQYDNKIVVYPNPASKILQLKIPEQSARVDLLLYTSTGLLIKRITGEKSRIDISGLASGIYFLKLNDRIGKFVKE